MKYFIIFLMALNWGKADGQDTLNLSLPELMAYSLSNNKSLHAGQLHYQLNEFRRKELNASLLPAVSWDAGIQHYFNVAKQYVAENAFSPSGSPDKYVGLKLLLPNNLSVGVSANWTVYNPAVNAALKILTAQNQLSDIRYEKDKTELAYSVSQLYYGIIFSGKQLESLKKVVANTDKLIGFLQSNYDNGLIKKSELEKVEVTKSTLTSQLTALQSGIDVQYNLLKLLMGLPETTSLRVSELDFEQSLQAFSGTQTPPENILDYQLLLAEKKITGLERKSILVSKYPLVGLAYHYSYNTVSPELHKVFSTSFTYPLQFISLGISVPLFAGNKNSYRLKQNSIISKQQELQTLFLADKIKTDILNSTIRFNTSLSTTHSNEANVKLAERLYTQSVLEYQQGTITLNEVVTTENSLYQALTEYFNSVSGSLLALLDYKKATNTIMNK